PANSIKNETPKINFVLTRIPYFSDPKDKPKETNAKKNALKLLNSMLYEAEIDQFQIEKAFVIHSDPDLEMQEKFKISYEYERSSPSNVSPIGLDYLELFEELTSDVISKRDKEHFDSFLKAEMLMEKAIANPDYYERIKGLNAALEINPGYRVALRHLATAYLNVNEYEKAIQYADSLLQKSNFYDLDLLHLKAAALFNLSELEAAILILSDILKKDDNDSLALLGLGMIRYRQGKLEEALVLQKKHVDIEPGDAMAWNGYANTLRAMGRLDEAMEAVYSALEIDPQDPSATGTLAEIHAVSGNIREFYKNLELSFSFGMNTKSFQDIIEVEDIYRQFAHDEKFKMILAKYDIDVDLSVLEK
ncbi:tetratricopeptide repeat protein, partial [Mucilaginibacter sp.]